MRMVDIPAGVICERSFDFPAIIMPGSDPRMSQVELPFADMDAFVPESGPDLM